MNRLRMVEVSACVLAATATSLLYLDFFASPRFLVAVAVAIVVAGGLALRRTWTVARLAAVSGFGFVLVTVPGALHGTVHHGLPTERTASDLLWGVVGGWSKMLSVSLPAAASGQVFVAALLLVWAQAGTAVALAVRTRAPLAPVVPLLAGQVIALVMVASQPDTHLAITAGFAALVLLVILMRAARVVEDQRAAWSLIAALPLAVAVVLAGSAVAASGLLATGRHRADPRPLHAESVSTPEIITPLATVKEQILTNPPRHLFSVRLPAGSDVSGFVGIRVAALDHFDGAVWTSTDEFVVAGQRLRADAALDPTPGISVRVTLDELSGPFLPVVGWPVLASFPGAAAAGIGYSARSGSLITSRALPAGTSYQMVGAYRSARELSRQARPGASAADQPYAQPPAGLSPSAIAVCDRVTGSEPSPGGKLAALEGYLRGLPYNLTSPPGHSVAVINRLLGPVGAHDDEGYAEQHASAFAVLARQLGYPARVAVGYRLSSGRAGEYDVSTREAYAWAEVHFDGYGWVAYDPTDPNHKTRSNVQNTGAKPSPRPTPLDNGGRTVPKAAPALPPAAAQSPGVDPATAAVLALGALAGLLVLAALAIASEKLRRRWCRRHARSPSAQVIGAWEEMMDRLAEQRMRVPLALTPREVAVRAGAVFGAAATGIAELAEPVTAAVFAPEYLDPADAQRAWDLERSLRADLYPGWRRLRRVGGWLDPRPLWTRRVPRVTGHRR